MRRLLFFSMILTLAAVLAAGCGGGGAASDAPSDANTGGEAGRADAAACAANRKTIFAAAQHYFAMEGNHPSSIRALVPGYLQNVPACPGGGSYTLRGSAVTCSIHGS